MFLANMDTLRGIFIVDFLAISLIVSLECTFILFLSSVLFL